MLTKHRGLSKTVGYFRKGPEFHWRGRCIGMKEESVCNFKLAQQEEEEGGERFLFFANCPPQGALSGPFLTVPKLNHNKHVP